MFRMNKLTDGSELGFKEKESVELGSSSTCDSSIVLLPSKQADKGIVKVVNKRLSEVYLHLI